MATYGTHHIVYGGNIRGGRAMPSCGITYEVNHLKMYVFDPLPNLIKHALDNLQHAEENANLFPTMYKMRIGQTDIELINKHTEQAEEVIHLSLIRKIRCDMSHATSQHNNNLLLIETLSSAMPNKVEVHIFQVLKFIAEEVMRNICKACERFESDLDIVESVVPDRLQRGRSELSSVVAPSDSPSNMKFAEGHRSVPPGGYSFEDDKIGKTNRMPFTAPQRPGSSIPDLNQVTNPNMNTLQSQNYQYSQGHLNPVGTTPEDAREEYMLMMYCLDDIEAFLDRLSPVLSTNKYWSSTMPSQPSSVPPPTEAMDILKKFKLAFNILSRLERKVFRPSAQELANTWVRHLQQVLPHYPTVAARCVSPLLSLLTLNFLKRCLSPSNMQFMLQLGPAWNIPRESWDKPCELYLPSFGNGMTPSGTWIANL